MEAFPQERQEPSGTNDLPRRIGAERMLIGAFSVTHMQSSQNWYDECYCIWFEDTHNKNSILIL